VFIDETAVTTKMVRHYGRSPRGERLVASVPHGHWKTLTFIAALRFDGMTAPYVIDGAMDGPTFIVYVEQVLTPTLKKGDIVFMDNLRTHKVDGVRQAIEAVGASVRYLPAYSPDLNPIEQAFSKLKTAMRKGRGPHCQGTLEADRQAHQDICARAVRQLLSTCRLWTLIRIKWKAL